MPRVPAKTGVAEARLVRQQLVLPRFAAPADVVRWFGAVQAQVTVGFDFWSAVTGRDRRAVARAVERYGRFLGRDVA